MKFNDGAVILYNSDYSGGAIIRSDGRQVHIPCSHIFDFVAEMIRDRKIIELEEMTSEDLLKGALR